MDAVPKVTGEAKYASDISLKGMLHAKVLLPPSHGAKLISVDISKAKSISGARIVKEDGLIAVLHEKPDMAADALALVKVKWDESNPKFDNSSVYFRL